MKKALDWFKGLSKLGKAGVIFGVIIVLGGFSNAVSPPEETAVPPKEETVVEQPAEKTEETEEPAEKTEEAKEATDDYKELCEWKLATIKAENPDLPKDDHTVGEFSKHLDSLEKKTNQNRQEISDMTVRTWEILKEEVNPEEDLLEVIYNLDDSIPDDTDIKLELSEVAALYITLRTQEFE